MTLATTSTTSIRQLLGATELLPMPFWPTFWVNPKLIPIPFWPTFWVNPKLIPMPFWPSFRVNPKSIPMPFWPCKWHIMPHPAQPQHTNYWAPRTRKRHQQEHRPQRPTERSDPTQHAKRRTGDCPWPRKKTTTTRRNVTQGGDVCVCPSPPHIPVSPVLLGACRVLPGAHVPVFSVQ